MDFEKAILSSKQDGRGGIWKRHESYDYMLLPQSTTHFEDSYTKDIEYTKMMFLTKIRTDCQETGWDNERRFEDGDA